MSVTVTLHVFSGRPDPSWELTATEANDLVARLKQIQKTTLLKPPGFASMLGYRGFSINAVREPSLDPQIYVHQGIVDLDRFDVNRVTDDPDLERWLLGTGGTAIPDDVRKIVQAELSGAANKPLLASAAPMIVLPYDPGKWNNDPSIRTRNNCYNYANDKITNTFAQPGRGSGSMFTSIDCANVGAASQRDRQIPTGTPSTTPAQGHFIALVIWPGNDYHWYRQDNNTQWSHKPGQTPARNTDNSGALIADPRNCNRGPYSEFCGFFHCIPANTKIS